MDPDTGLAGHQVIDDHNNPIGTVTDVLFDQATMDPQWVVVDPGPLRAEHAVPLQHAYQTGDGRLKVPFDKQTVKHSPKVREHVMTSELETELRQYYGIAS